MSQCKRCMQLAIDTIYYIGNSNLDKSIESIEELLSILKTYKESY